MTRRRALKRKLASAIAPEEAIRSGFFSELASHNQMDVLKKLKFKDFVRFTKCSKETVEISTNFRHQLPLKVDLIRFSDKDITIRSRVNGSDIEAIIMMRPKRHGTFPRNAVVYDDFDKFFNISHKSARFETKLFEIYAPKSCNMNLEEFCRRIQCTAQTMTVFKVLDPTTFNTTRKLLKAEKIAIGFSFPISEMINDPEDKTLNEIEIKEGVEISEADFLHLPATKITADYEGTSTFSMINSFVKQWSEGIRSIEKLLIRHIPSSHSEILTDLDHTVLLKLEIYKLLKEDTKYTPSRVYSLRRRDGKSLHIAITNTTVGSAYRKHVHWHLTASESDISDVKEYLLSLRSTYSQPYQCPDCHQMCCCV